MKRITKMGAAENLYPALEELFAIKRIREVLIEFSYDISGAGLGGSEYFQNYSKPLIAEHWKKIRYYKQSRYLSKQITTFEKDILLKRNDMQINKAQINNLLMIWDANYSSPQTVLEDVLHTKRLSEEKPVPMICLSTREDWIYKGIHYSTSGPYSDEELSLLILDEFDKERQLFEKLKQKHINGLEELDFKRQRIPEAVRIEVWRRDGGICARCSSRENLEYDHIVPVSKGGGNTARNIELLCEKCNRSKSNNIA